MTTPTDPNPVQQDDFQVGSAERGRPRNGVRRSVALTIEPTETPARDLPFGMAYDVCRVLKAHGLNVLDESLQGQGMLEVQIALVEVIHAVPLEQGGRKGEIEADR